MTETAQAIMDAAERRIRDAGYHGFSFREIADEIGIKSASVHYHFRTKEALAVAVARRYADRFLEALDERIAVGADVVEAWTGGFRRALTEDGRMCLCGALGAGAGALPDGVLAEARRFFRLAVEGLIGAGLSRNRALQVIAGLEGGILLASVLQDPQAFEAAAAGVA